MNRKHIMKKSMIIIPSSICKSLNCVNYTKIYTAILLLSFIFLSSLIIAGQDNSVPSLEKRVTDLSGTLTEFDIQNIEKKLLDFERRQGSQIVVLIVPTTGSESIEKYSMRVAEQLKIGKKGTDNGVILIIAKNDRKLRIEVGYGLEAIITDASASHIIDDYITPNFKNGNFAGGIKAGIQQIMYFISGEQLPETETQNTTAQDFSYKQTNIIGHYLMLGGFFIGLIVIVIILKLKLKGFWAVLPATILVMALGGYISFFSVMTFVLMGVLVFMSLILRLVAKYSKIKRTYSDSSSDSYDSFSSTSWSSDSWDDDFGGGGGSFGGGGAFGGW